MDDRYFALFIILGGVFGMLGAYFQWEFFFAHRKAKWMTKTVGLRNARIFYFVVGLIAFLLGWGLFLGFVPMEI